MAATYGGAKAPQNGRKDDDQSQGQRFAAIGAGGGRYAAALRAAQRSRAERCQIWLRARPVRRLHGWAVRSCVTEIGTIGEAEITTIEGLGTVDTPHPLQQAFIDLQAAQCGYCINGMIMTAKDLLDQNPHPTIAEVREGLAQNLCRCGTHGRIVRAVLRAAQNMGKKI